MNVDLSKIISSGDCVAVALSGGSDSMALLEFLLENKTKYNYFVIALNIEHGIRGQESINDSLFVKNYCEKKGIELLSYSLNCLEYSKQNGLTIEEGARKLRYECFYDAINSGKCNKVATAHHLSDNFESILLNLFRGTGTKGLIGITDNFDNKIIRPFISISKQEINSYVNEKNIPFVTDSTNLCDDYTRNNLRLNIIPKIKEVFPKAEQSVFRMSEILKEYEKYLDIETDNILYANEDAINITLPANEILISRATIKAMKKLGVKKDWSKAHADEIVNLAKLNNGAMINLPNNIVAVKEYNRICFYQPQKDLSFEIPFALEPFIFNNKTYSIKQVKKPDNLKNGFYADLDKIPSGCVIRTRQDGDVFTKFGGGTKKLNDFLTDKKIPIRQRNSIPVIAKDNIIYFIFEIAISNQIKVDENSQNIVQFG